MSTDFPRLQKYLDYHEDVHDESDWKTRLRPKTSPLPRSIPRGFTPEALDARWETLSVNNGARGEIADLDTCAKAQSYKNNIENFIGTVKVPVGVAGPLRINGLFAQGDYYVPLATTEAALVASYNRGMRIISEAGGCTTVLANEGVNRAPGFAFDNLTEAAIFIVWTMGQMKKIKYAAEKTTRYGKLIDIQFTIEGNHVYFVFDFVTSDASGQNMATIASQAICDYIMEHSPLKPKFYFSESNLSGDKKATSQSFQTVRGRKVTAETFIPRALVEKGLHTTPEEMARYSSFAMVASSLSGSIGSQGHYANALTALYIACGQDVACVAESAVGITRMDTTEEGDLHLCVTLPSLMVATVGGGTAAPSQAACLDILGLKGPGNAHAFAEVAIGLCLAGELSIAAAICSHQFVRAHSDLARGNGKPRK
ncbi:MAG: hydroxymethylglutaryl-CoA reductase [Candidatus Krumholzibacteria bacterium]|nr:hydroxymethylglutaryl-CoA reductase [Candidatus Krumholzibacteria bacterium]